MAALGEYDSADTEKWIPDLQRIDQRDLSASIATVVSNARDRIEPFIENELASFQPTLRMAQQQEGGDGAGQDDSDPCDVQSYVEHVQRR